MTSTYLANEKVKKQAIENAANWYREQIEAANKYIAEDQKTGYLYWMYGED